MNTQHMTKRIGTRTARHSAFTLIELLLVMVILVVLASVVVPKFTDRTRQARVTAAMTDIHILETSLDAFEVDCGRHPATEDGLAALVQQPSWADGWHGPYVKSVPLDPWKNPYNYQYPGTHNTAGFDLWSWGPEGREGAGNITNWDQAQ